MNNIGKIIGFPIKLFSHNMIYIPMEYLRYYGISTQKDRILLLRSRRSLFYKPLQKADESYSTKETVSVRIGLTTMPAAWVRENKLKKGDTLFLLGTSDGMLHYIRDLVNK